MDKPGQDYLMLKAIIEPASQTVLRVNQEPQSPLLSLSEFLSGKRHEGWEVAGIAPSGSLLLLILKRARGLAPQPPLSYMPVRQASQIVAGENTRLAGRRGDC